MEHLRQQQISPSSVPSNITINNIQRNTLDLELPLQNIHDRLRSDNTVDARYSLALYRENELKRRSSEPIYSSPHKVRMMAPIPNHSPSYQHRVSPSYQRSFPNSSPPEVFNNRNYVSASQRTAVVDTSPHNVHSKPDIRYGVHNQTLNNSYRTNTGSTENISMNAPIGHLSNINKKPHAVKRTCKLCDNEAQFLCSGCRVAWYCSQKCQVSQFVDKHVVEFKGT